VLYKFACSGRSDAAKVAIFIFAHVDRRSRFEHESLNGLFVSQALLSSGHRLLVCPVEINNLVFGKYAAGHFESLFTRALCGSQATDSRDDILLTRMRVETRALVCKYYASIPLSIQVCNIKNGHLTISMSLCKAVVAVQHHKSSLQYDSAAGCRWRFELRRVLMFLYDSLHTGKSNGSPHARDIFYIDSADDPLHRTVTVLAHSMFTHIQERLMSQVTKLCGQSWKEVVQAIPHNQQGPGANQHLQYTKSSRTLQQNSRIKESLAQCGSSVSKQVMLKLDLLTGLREHLHSAVCLEASLLNSVRQYDNIKSETVSSALQDYSRGSLECYSNSLPRSSWTPLRQCFVLHGFTKVFVDFCLRTNHILMRFSSDSIRGFKYICFNQKEVNFARSFAEFLARLHTWASLRLMCNFVCTCGDKLIVSQNLGISEEQCQDQLFISLVYTRCTSSKMPSISFVSHPALQARNYFISSVQTLKHLNSIYAPIQRRGTSLRTNSENLACDETLCNLKITLSKLTLTEQTCCLLSQRVISSSSVMLSMSSAELCTFKLASILK